MTHSVQQEIARHEAQITASETAIQRLSPLKDVPGISYVVHWGGGVELHIAPDADPVDTLTGIMRAWRVRMFRKHFDENTGEIEYLADIDKEKIVVKGHTPTACEVETVEVEEFRPAQTVRVKKFRLKNPEKCLGIQAQA